MIDIATCEYSDEVLYVLDNNYVLYTEFSYPVEEDINKLYFTPIDEISDIEDYVSLLDREVELIE